MQNNPIKKILVIIGTRPEAIKLAPVIHELKSQACDDFETKVCVTAQHRHLLDQEMDFFGIVPDYDLNLMVPNQPLWRLTAEALVELSLILQAYKPDIVLVQGDTTSTFTGALAAFYQKIPVGHIEAGLRTGDIYSPFPEEIYRRMIAPTTKFHFPATDRAANNLAKEGIATSQIFVTGNTVIDALQYAVKNMESHTVVGQQCDQWLQETIPNHQSIQNKKSRLILVTAHRRESFGEGLEAMYTAIRKLANQFSNDSFVYPVHPNPNIQDSAVKILGNLPNVHLIDPVGYQKMVYLMTKAYLVLTDSGGIQEEAPTLKLPVLVMREKTERIEGVREGVSLLVGCKTENIVHQSTELLSNQSAYETMRKGINPYGDGSASTRIVQVLRKYL